MTTDGAEGHVPPAEQPQVVGPLLAEGVNLIAQVRDPRQPDHSPEVRFEEA